MVNCTYFNVYVYAYVRMDLCEYGGILKHEISKINNIYIYEVYMYILTPFDRMMESKKKKIITLCAEIVSQFILIMRSFILISLNIEYFCNR